MARTVVYVANAESQSISMFLMHGTELEPAGTVAIPGPEKRAFSTPMALSPDRRFLFVGLRNEPYSVVTFSIDPASGALNFIGSGPLADQMCYLSVDRTGRYLFAASYQGSKVTVSPIAEGGLCGPAHQIIPTKPKAHCIVPTRANRHVLHTSLGGGVVYQQRFDPGTGMLSPNDPPERGVRAGAGPRHITLSQDETRAYLINELDASLYVFPFDCGTGALGAEIQIVDTLPEGFSGTPSAAEIRLTPSGRFLYTSERTSNTLAAFRVAADGKLTLIGHYPTETVPRGFNIDPSGHVLLAVGQESHSMTSYAIDQMTGELITLKRHAVGRNPNWVEFVVLP
jgi:6-phosphogluconolactonase